TTLTFPLGVSHDDTARLLAALVGLSKPVYSRADQPGKPLLIFELLGTAQGIFHQLSFPRELVRTVPNHLLGVLPSLGIIETPRRRHTWRGGVALGREVSAVAELDLSAVPVVLGSFSGLRPGEALVAQFVTTPLIDSVWDLNELTYSVLASRLAVCGPDERRAQYLIQSVLMAYRGLAVVPTGALSRRELRLLESPETPDASRARALVSASSLAATLALPICSPQVP